MLAVVLDHFFGAPRGGFLGVDVFFVVSGFVITAQLLSEHERSGRVSLPRFWWRRLTRLVPVLLTVLLVTVVVVGLTTPGRLAGVLVDAAAAALSVANWRFIQNGTDYFASFAATSPLQHTWSLSVEEQFYVVWPALLLVSLGLGARLRRRGTGRPRLALVAIVAIAAMVVSVGAAVTMLGDPTTAYFSTVSRAWELLAGAVVAIVVHRRRASEGSRAVPVVALLGTALIVLSFLVVDPDVPAPVPAALGAVFGTCLVLSYGAASRMRSVLGWRPLVSLGNASYPIYLWHLPVLVVVTAVLPGSPWLTLPLTAALGILTHLLVEEPVRAWGRRRSSVDRERSRASRGSRATVGIVSLLCAVMVGTALWTHEPTRPTTVDRGAPTAGPLSAALRDDLATALEATEWPEKLEAHDPELRGVRECGDRDHRPTVRDCTFGSPDAAKTAVLVGDSIAGAWLEALVPLVEHSSEWRLLALPRNGCPFIALDLAHAPGRDCARERAAVVAAVGSAHPELVIVSSRDSAEFLAPDGVGTADDEQVAEAAATMHRRVGAHADQVVVLTAPPVGADLRTCRTTVGGPADCVEPARSGSRDAALARAAHSNSTATSVVDTSQLVAVDGLTPAFAGNRAVREDTVHLTPAFSRSIGPALAELLADAGVRLM
ncbi:peptidoglycan/LPS O-acetylase OafA/YrhL [Curtobacterium pusillum]|uniref:Peptidoglycan/LPS O-acetylase OafA/YrhL n=1 Tax=Curtobacterium pusillum TaxID=69373 RepID=A0AAW3T5V3_9MICO|nr:peptidoglycan/LPS O-acetylase OafA/YrhL [Curtobacterium pusillum]